MLALAPIVATAANAVAQVAANIVTQPSTPVADGPSFAQFVEQFASQTVDSLKASESAAISSATGDLPVQKIVDSVLGAERQLHTVIALRDRAVSAYQEISRMAI